jgi:adenylate cyclase
MGGSNHGPVFDDDDVVWTLRRLGIPDDAIARAIARGDPEGAIFDAVLMPAIAERTVTAIDVERRGGLGVDEVQAFVAAFGVRVPEPDEPAFTPEEAAVLVELEGLKEVWPFELDLRLGRVWGPLLARVAQSAIQMFRIIGEPPLRSDDLDRLAGLREVQNAFARLLPLADPILVGVVRRWIEHELAQAAVTEAEASAGEQRLPGAETVSLLFCDLKDYTAFANAEGDAAAFALVEQFAEAVAGERGEEFRLMKSLGDGVMLVYDDVAAAVTAGARIIARMSGSPLGVHGSVHHGVALARDGDYFGSAVNLAARLLGIALHQELVATQQVVDRTADSFTWQPAGVHEIRGVTQPVHVFRLLQEPASEA